MGSTAQHSNISILLERILSNYSVGVNISDKYRESLSLTPSVSSNSGHRTRAVDTVFVSLSKKCSKNIAFDSDAYHFSHYFDRHLTSPESVRVFCPATKKGEATNYSPK